MPPVPHVTWAKATLTDAIFIAVWLTSNELANSRSEPVHRGHEQKDLKRPSTAALLIRKDPAILYRILGFIPIRFTSIFLLHPRLFSSFQWLASSAQYCFLAGGRCCIAMALGREFAPATGNLFIAFIN